MTHTLDEIKKMLEGISPWPWTAGKIQYKHWRHQGKNDAGNNFKHPNGCRNYGCSILDREASEKIYTPRIVCEVLDSDMQLVKHYEQDAKFIASAPQIVSELMAEVEYWQKRYDKACEAQENYYNDGFNHGYRRRLQENNVNDDRNQTSKAATKKT